VAVSTFGSKRRRVGEDLPSRRSQRRTRAAPAGSSREGFVHGSAAVDASGPPLQFEATPSERAPPSHFCQILQADGRATSIVDSCQFSRRFVREPCRHYGGPLCRSRPCEPASGRGPTRNTRLARTLARFRFSYGPPRTAEFPIDWHRQHDHPLIGPSVHVLNATGRAKHSPPSSPECRSPR